MGKDADSIKNFILHMMPLTLYLATFMIFSTKKKKKKGIC
jgi:hypothetical protein